MKVGNLVRVIADQRSSDYISGLIGQIGLIVDLNDDVYAVVVLLGKEFFLYPHELEVIS